MVLPLRQQNIVHFCREYIHTYIYIYMRVFPLLRKNKHRLSCCCSCCCCYCRSLFFRPTYLLSLIIACCSSLVEMCLYVLWSIFASIEKNFCCLRLICWNKQCDWNESICWWRWWLLLQTISNVHFCVVFIFLYFFFFNFVRFFLFLLFSFFLHFFLFVFFLYKYFLQREKRKILPRLSEKETYSQQLTSVFRSLLSSTFRIERTSNRMAVWRNTAVSRSKRWGRRRLRWRNRRERAGRKKRMRKKKK